MAEVEHPWRGKTFDAQAVYESATTLSAALRARPAQVMRLKDTQRLFRVAIREGDTRWGITPSDPMGTTMRRFDTGQGGNRIVTRSGATLRPGMQAKASDVTRAARVMQRKFDQRFPQLAGMRMEYAWAGHLCLTMNGVAVARRIEDGVFSGCVQNGLGTARGTLTGICAAELAMGHESAITRHFTAEAQPSRLPLQPFREIGANAVLRWKEWKARDD